KLPTAAKNLVNAIAESPVSGSMSSQLGAVGDLGKLGGGQKDQQRLFRILVDALLMTLLLLQLNQSTRKV
ncbi:hypothetical protein KUT40_31890, partial [Pseudomonas aeruginosa]|nr:hypothetical protein [Pseudomonas aeruginosa]